MMYLWRSQDFLVNVMSNKIDAGTESAGGFRFATELTVGS